ncbi:hypothetical protein LTR95_001928 [Oleoguttula sp. CCFEE 5521]
MTTAMKTTATKMRAQKRSATTSKKAKVATWEDAKGFVPVVTTDFRFVTHSDDTDPARYEVIDWADGGTAKVRHEISVFWATKAAAARLKNPAQNPIHQFTPHDRLNGSTSAKGQPVQPRCFMSSLSNIPSKRTTAGQTLSHACDICVNRHRPCITTIGDRIYLVLPELGDDSVTAFDYALDWKNFDTKPKK